MTDWGAEAEKQLRAEGWTDEDFERTDRILEARRAAWTGSETQPSAMPPFKPDQTLGRRQASWNRFGGMKE